MKKRGSVLLIACFLLIIFLCWGCRNPAAGTDSPPSEESTPESETSYTSEGTIDNPIEITDYNTEIAGTVGTDRSYYKTSGDAAGDHVTVYLDNLTDDGDLIEFGTDSAYSREGDKPFYGRTMKESVVKGSWGVQDLYFVVDGSYTSAGAAYTLRVTSLGNATSIFVNQGTSSNPVEIDTGYQVYGQVGTDGTSYYKAAVSQGTVYCVNAYTGVTLTVYSDQFTTPVTLPYTSQVDTLYLKVAGSYTSFVMEVVKKEGSTGTPVSLFVEKTNFCQIDNTSSCYSFAVQQGSSYTVSADAVNSRRTPAGYDIDLFVYNDNSFTNLAGSSETSTVPETVTLTASTGTITVRVDEKSGSGATFILKVTKN